MGEQVVVNFVVVQRFREREFFEFEVNFVYFELCFYFGFVGGFVCDDVDDVVLVVFVEESVLWFLQNFDVFEVEVGEFGGEDRLWDFVDVGYD